MPTAETDPVAEGDLAQHVATEPAHGGDLAGAPRPPLAHLHTIPDVSGLQAGLDGKQPADSDLTALAGLGTTVFGRSLLELADAAAARAAIGAQPAGNYQTAGDYQPHDADLDAIAALATTAFGRSLLALADAGAGRSALGAQAQDSDLDAIAALSTTSFGRGLLTQADAAAVRTALALGSAALLAAGAANGAATLDSNSKIVQSRADQAILLRELSDLARASWLPSGAIAETFPRYLCMNPLSIVSGRLQLTGGLVLPGGRTVSSITTFAHGTGATSPTHQWFCLIDKAGNVLAKTADAGTAAWGAGAVKTLSISGGYTPASAMEVYLGVVVTAATPPALSRPGSASGASIGGGGYGDNGNSGYTDPASLGSSIVIPTLGQNIFYGYVS